jgi:3',5'-cyclic AMP phosphodiesterase CpdA
MSISRRDALGILGAGLAALALPRPGAALEPPVVPATPLHPVTGAPRVLRLAHLTDCHLPVDGQTERFVNCLHQVQAEADPPELVLFGGDNVMAVDGQDRASAEAQFGHWTEVVESELKLPYRSVIGNHDIWNWPEPGGDRRQGKQFAVDTFHLPAPYYSFVQAGWRFVLLDSFQLDGCYIDQPQLDWLRSEIDASGEHVVVLSHAPLLSASVLIDKDSQRPAGWAVPANNMANNAVALRDLFYDREQVRLALSGHMHHVDRVDYDRVTYLCNGAVSGSWWNGSYHKFGPAYAMLDLYADGSFQHAVRFWEQPG